MSSLTPDPVLDNGAAAVETPAGIQSFPARETTVGDLVVRRALPVRERRMVGPWCFLDRYGPLSFTDAKPMDVAPHPHMGLQTVSWLFEGEVVHHDSLGCEALVRPGDVAVMTAGRGIAHAEETPPDHSGRLNGVQLWVALPDAHRNGPAAFAHHAASDPAETAGGLTRVFVGAILGAASPAPAFSPAVGADLTVFPAADLALPVRAEFEHALLVISGDVSLEDQVLAEHRLYYLAPGRRDLTLRSRRGGRVLLVGGAPFGEPVVMWWNFVARSPEEIAAARAEWERHERFGEVAAYDGPRLRAPSLAARPVRPHGTG